MSLRKLLDLTKPQFPHLTNGSYQEVVEETNGLTIQNKSPEKYKAECQNLVYSLNKYLPNVSTFQGLGKCTKKMPSS